MACLLFCSGPKPVYKPTRALAEPLTFDAWHKRLLETDVYSRAEKIEIETRRGSIITKTPFLKVKNALKGTIVWLNGTVETIIFAPPPPPSPASRFAF